MRDCETSENNAAAVMLNAQNKSSVSKIKSLKFRLMVIPLLATLVLGAIMMLALVSVYQRRLNREYINRGIAVTKTMASLISGEMIDRYLSSLEKDKNYETVLRHLRSIQQANEMKYLYVTRMTEDGQIFVFDTDPEAPVALGGYVSWADSLGPGYDGYTATLYRGGRVEPLIANTVGWGWVLSVYEPIYRVDGTVAGFAGADVSMKQVFAERRYIITFSGAFIALIFIAAAAINLLAAQKYVISPVAVLVRKAASVLPDAIAVEQAAKNFSHNKEFKSRLRFEDEFAILERSLFDMEMRVSQAILELKKAQESEHKASESKTVFLANMSHELRTPLNTILNMTKQVMDARQNAENVMPLKQILASSRELLSVINTILEISNIENRKLTLVMAPLEMRDVFYDIGLITAQQCAVEKLHWASETGAANAFTVNGDKLRLTQVLTMLLRNAVKYAAEPGCVLFSAKPAGETDSSVSILFEISCRGSRMPAKESEELSVLFNSESNSGCDADIFDYKWVLLSVCSSLVQAMGGKIEIRNEAKALIFSFALKFQKAAPAPKKFYAENLSDVDFSGKRIMIVDDSATNRMVVKNILKYTKADFLEAKDGQEALDLFAGNLESREKIDAILMDISMPNMDGYEATRKIREAEAGLSRTPIIALTAHTYQEDVEAALSAGMDFHLGKPIELKALIGALKHHIESDLEA